LEPILGADHQLVRERREKLAELAPDAAMDTTPAGSGKTSPNILLQRKLRYLDILEQKLAKQDKRVEEAKTALTKAEAAL
jgi:hypothetical protein